MASSAVEARFTETNVSARGCSYKRAPRYSSETHTGLTWFCWQRHTRPHHPAWYHASPCLQALTASWIVYGYAQVISPWIHKGTTYGGFEFIRTTQGSCTTPRDSQTSDRGWPCYWGHWKCGSSHNAAECPPVYCSVCVSGVRCPSSGRTLPTQGGPGKCTHNKTHCCWHVCSTFNVSSTPWSGGQSSRSWKRDHICRQHVGRITWSDGNRQCPPT